MRIALYGAAGTGKTTLARMIQEELGVPFNPVGSRSVAKAMGFDNPYDVDKHGRRAEFQRRLVVEKIAWEAEHASFVTDRTTYDNLVYTMFHDVHAIDDELLNFVRTGFERYNTAVFCPMGSFWSLGDDAVRMKSKSYHRCFELVIRGLVTDRLMSDTRDLSSFVHLTVHAHSLDERRQWVRSLKEVVKW